MSENGNTILQMPPPAKARISWPRRILLAVVLLLLLLLSVAGWLYAGRMEAQGVLEGQLLPIVPPMTARVSEVLVTEGQTVHAGQVLVRLDGSSFYQQEADARALVRGAYIPSMEETAEKAAAAQAAEEYTVRRVAVSRYEEQTQRQLLEQRAHEHARAQLRMRDMDARGASPTSKARQEAKQAEEQARWQLEQARANHEMASRARAAVEGELQRARQDVDRLRASGRAPLQSTAPRNPPVDPTAIIAPQDGRLMGKLPEPGQMLTSGETVLQLVPGSSTALWAVAEVSPAEAEKLRIGQLCFVVPTGATGPPLRAEVGETLTQSSVPAKQGSERVAVRIRLLDARVPELSAQLAGKPARVVVWTNTLPGIQYAMPWYARWSLL